MIVPCSGVTGYTIAALAAVVLTIGAGAARAGLKFEASTVATEVEPGQVDVRAAFPFANVGKKPVTITHVESTCNCTVPTLEKYTFEPGERGTVRVVYTPPAGVFGKDEKLLRVETDDPDQAMLILRLSVYVHPRVAVRPGALYWSNGGAPAAKAVTVTVRGDRPADGLTATVDGPGFHVTVEPVSAGREYTVAVRPESTRDVRQAVVRLEARGADPPAYPPQFTVGVMAPGVNPPAE